MRHGRPLPRLPYRQRGRRPGQQAAVCHAVGRGPSPAPAAAAWEVHHLHIRSRDQRPKTDAPEIWQPADDYPPEAAFVIRTGACVGIVVPFMFSAKVADGKLMLHEGAHFCAGAPVPVPAVIPTLAERGVIVQVGTRTLVAFDLKNRHKKSGVLHISPASPDAS